eukprot:1158843-Pelagomonas_calceolata.AAC.10
MCGSRHRDPELPAKKHAQFQGVCRHSNNLPAYSAAPTPNIGQTHGPCGRVQGGRVQPQGGWQLGHA